MWPPTLKIDRDDCRRKLRRLELESYSSVISVFRAQGSLSETKVKLLEDLRNVFHISPERHRAEARRVANDEHLSTIADSLSAPNSWQEWSREGRRAYPMLPRVAPQTALALIANDIAVAAAAENSKLPYPAETGRDYSHVNSNTESNKNDNESHGAPVVTSSPFKMPEAPRKKALKRSSSDSVSIQRKRVQDMLPKQTQLPQPPLGTVVSVHAKKPMNNHTKSPQQRGSPSQQQQQQQHKQKVAVKKALQGKRQQSPIKANKKLMKFHEQQVAGHEQLQLALIQSAQQQSQNAAAAESSPVKGEHGSEVKLGMSTMPQIAASKKDITKNLTKLQISNVVSPTSPLLTTSIARVATIETRPTPSSTLIVPVSKIEKPIHSTPVKKYIVEERQPPAAITGQITSLPQVLTLPQLSAVPTRLRPVNQTILQSGSKMTPKKVNPAILGQSASTVLPTINLIDSNASSGVSNATQPQLFNIIDNTAAPLVAQNLTATPLQTAPTVIQLPPSIIANNADPLQQSTQSKVLTKVVYNGNPANMPKLESFSNGAMIIRTCTATATSSAFSTVYKTLPTTMIVTGTVHTSPPDLMSSINSPSTSLYRKPNIIKSGGSALGKFTVPNSGSQFLSNIKLTPTVTTTITGSTTTSQQLLPQQIKLASPASVRANVRICHSPNGKFILHSARSDGVRPKVTGNFPQKLLTNALGPITVPTSVSSNLGTPKLQVVTAASTNVASVSKVQQRIQQGSQQQKTGTISLGNKNNVIFMPQARTGAGPITLAKSAVRTQQSTELGKQNVVVIGPSAPGSTLKPATVIANNKVIALSAAGTSTGVAHQIINQMITEDTPVDILNVPYVADSGSRGVSIVKGGTTTNLVADNIAVLSGSLVRAGVNESSATQQSSEVGSKASSGFVDATDWEMELDQATIVAKVHNQHKVESTNRLAEEHKTTPDAESCEDDFIEDNVELVETPTKIEVLNGKTGEALADLTTDVASVGEGQQVVQLDDELSSEEDPDVAVELTGVSGIANCEDNDANGVEALEGKGSISKVSDDKPISEINEKSDGSFLPIKNVSDDNGTIDDVEQVIEQHADLTAKVDITVQDA